MPGDARTRRAQRRFEGTVGRRRGAAAAKNAVPDTQVQFVTEFHNPALVEELQLLKNRYVVYGQKKTMIWALKAYFSILASPMFTSLYAGPLKEMTKASPLFVEYPLGSLALVLCMSTVLPFVVTKAKPEFSLPNRLSLTEYIKDGPHHDETAKEFWRECSARLEISSVIFLLISAWAVVSYKVKDEVIVMNAAFWLCANALVFVLSYYQNLNAVPKSIQLNLEFAIAQCETIFGDLFSKKGAQWGNDEHIVVFELGAVSNKAAYDFLTGLLKSYGADILEENHSSQKILFILRDKLKEGDVQELRQIMSDYRAVQSYLEGVARVEGIKCGFSCAEKRPLAEIEVTLPSANLVSPALEQLLRKSRFVTSYQVNGFQLSFTIEASQLSCLPRDFFQQLRKAKESEGARRVAGGRPGGYRVRLSSASLYESVETAGSFVREIAKSPLVRALWQRFQAHAPRRAEYVWQLDNGMTLTFNQPARGYAVGAFRELGQENGRRVYGYFPESPQLENNLANSFQRAFKRGIGGQGHCIQHDKRVGYKLRHEGDQRLISHRYDNGDAILLLFDDGNIFNHRDMNNLDLGRLGVMKERLERRVSRRQDYLNDVAVEVGGNNAVAGPAAGH